MDNWKKTAMEIAIFFIILFICVAIIVTLCHYIILPFIVDDVMDMIAARQ